MKKLILMGLLVAASTVVMAKLPAPVLDDAAKVKAEEAKARAAHTGKVGAYQLCMAMERAATHHFKTAAAMGKPVKPAQPSPSCSNPGAFVWPSPSA